MKRKFVETAHVVRVWDIDGYPAYFFGNDKELYRIDSRGRLVPCKRQQKRYTLGHHLKSRFFNFA